MSLLYTSEQLANRVHGVPRERRAGRDKQTDRQTRTSSSSSADDDNEYLREASRLSEHDRAGRLDDPETRGPERRDA